MLKNLLRIAVLPNNDDTHANIPTDDDKFIAKVIDVMNSVLNGCGAIVASVLAFSTLLLIGLLIYFSGKLSAAAHNPMERQVAWHRLLGCIIAASFIGAADIIVLTVFMFGLKG